MSTRLTTASATLPPPPATPTWCYTIPVGQDPAKHGGYVPSAVFLNEPGHYPMVGKGAGAAPWIWGQTLTEAQTACVAFNAKSGITEAMAEAIVASTFRHK